MTQSAPTDLNPWLALPYRPAELKSPPPGIALVGCGGISRHHLQAYVAAHYPVLALCDIDLNRAEQQRDKFYPGALATDNLDEVLALPEVKVIDITTHPFERVGLIERSLKAGKHVLSQKPFVLDLPTGERLAKVADDHGVQLAVNQNARWAPHFSYFRAAAEAELLGPIHAAHFCNHWDHSWTKDTPFEEIRHLILYDFAIHWFDLLICLMQGRPATKVYASFTDSPTQDLKASLMAQVSVEFDNAQATLVFDGHSPEGDWATVALVGSKGLLRSAGFGDNDHQVTLMTNAGNWEPKLEGQWFDDGFHGTMAELLSAIEEDRPATHSARNNLASLALCFAAIESAETGKPVKPGTVTELPAAAR